jgi:carboxyl-terminal processing protease
VRRAQLPLFALAAFVPLAFALGLAEPAGSAEPVLAAAQSGAAQPGAAPSGARGQDQVDPKALKMLSQVLEHVRGQFVEELSDEQLIEAAIGGIMGSLDPHSTYMNADKYADMRERTSGQFGGLGIEIQMEGGAVKVISPLDESPAARAGIQAGDLIVEIDGEPVQGLSLKQASDRLRGSVGSEVGLKVKRGSAEPFALTVGREIVRTRSVKFETDEDVGYIRISTFNQQTQSGLEAAVREIEGKLGPRLRGYVIDLRNNPGGLLRQGVSVADSFLDQGAIVSTKGRGGKEIERFTATPGDLARGLPVVVLVNGGSASASEIVAGALQDHGRATVLGTQSFGKGSVQTILPLRQGKGAIKMTTARYYTPSGRSIQNVGIAPDTTVEQAKGGVFAEPEIRKEAQLRNTLGNDAPPEPGLVRQAKAEPGPAAPPEAENTDWQRKVAAEMVRAGGPRRAPIEQQAAIPN